jgi:nucleoid-associated protein YgaU
LKETGMTKNQKITIGAVLVVSAGALIYSLATYKGHSAPKVEETASGPTINDVVIGEQTAPTPVAGTTGAPGTATPTGTTPGQGVPPSASATNTLAGTTGAPGTPGTPATPGLTVTPTAGPVAPAVTTDAPVAVSYTVKKGDTLHSIAKAELGSDAKWKDILAANPSLDPKKLKIGMKLQMPSKAGTTSVASAGTTSAIAPGGTAGVTAINGSTPGTTATTGSPGFTPVSNPVAPATGATKAKPVATAPKTTSGTSTKVSTGKVSTRDGVSIYTVRDGDTLRSISKDVYRGDEAKWESVFRLNRDVIGSDPGRLEAGTILILPASGK